MRPGRLLVALTSVFIVSACSPTGALTPTSVPETPPRTTSISQSPTITETLTPTASPTPSPSVFESFPPPPADETPEQAAIRQGWMDYWIVYDRFTSNPSMNDFTETQLVTVNGSKQAKVILDSIQRLRAKGWKISGGHVLRNYSISVEPAEVDGIRSVVITYCYDGRHKSVVEVDSGQVVPTAAGGTYFETAWLEQGADGMWRVALIGNERKSC